ncbi:hypothetical protein LTR15_000415 [Elasticomyces elasticus]|nr:hypothetical protein LTR15_000415 [Elasticomyces elasticus]
MADDMDETVVYNLDDELARAEEWDGDADTLNGLVDIISSAWFDRDLEAVSALCLNLLKNKKLSSYWRGRFNAYMSFISGEDAEQRLDEASFWLQKAAANTTDSGDSEQIELWQARVKRAQNHFVGLRDEQQPAILGFQFDGTAETPGDAAIEGTVDSEVFSQEQTDAIVEIEEDSSETRDSTSDVLADRPKQKLGKRVIHGFRHPMQSIADLRGKAKAPPQPRHTPRLALSEYDDTTEKRRLSRFPSEPQLQQYGRPGVHDSSVFNDRNFANSSTVANPVVATPNVIPPTPHHPRASLLSGRRYDNRFLGAPYNSPRQQRSFTSDPGTPTKDSRAEYKRNSTMMAQPPLFWQRPTTPAGNTSVPDQGSQGPQGSQAQGRPRAPLSWRDFAAAKAGSTRLDQASLRDSSRASVQTANADAEPMYTTVGGRRHRLVSEGQGLYRLEMVEASEGIHPSFENRSDEDDEREFDLFGGWRDRH